MNVERRLGDVEELETGIAVNSWFCLADDADRPGLIAWSNPMPRGAFSLFVPATSSPFCSKTPSTGEPRTVPSLSPLRREGAELNKDFGWYKSSRSPCSEMSLIGQTGSTGSYTA
jgi:hypothetical protein